MRTTSGAFSQTTREALEKLMNKEELKQSIKRLQQWNNRASEWRDHTVDSLHPAVREFVLQILTKEKDDPSSEGSIMKGLAARDGAHHIETVPTLKFPHLETPSGIVIGLMTVAGYQLAAEEEAARLTTLLQEAEKEGEAK